ncbi:MAG TPA: YggS family pyridoxal phosphate-dependent enzyme [Rubrobacteraceae bacterium]|nr:YggS family pyridoxal phosphate-dependent enzyme [Rubrobacteraceae bacterium]
MHGLSERPLLLPPQGGAADRQEPGGRFPVDAVKTRVSAERIRERIAVVREKVAEALRRSGRGPEETRILVASKYYGSEQIAVLAGAGINLLGENRSEDLIRKQEAFGDAFEWHFIGHLQRRKARDVVGRVSLIHSVDSARLIEELDRRAPQDGLDVLIQVNVSGEESKYGVLENELEDLLRVAANTRGKVRVRGFMTIAPLVEDPEDVRYVFSKLRTIRDRLKADWAPHFDLSELSMGMSGDYVVAVEEGATLVRIGRIIIEEDGP